MKNTLIIMKKELSSYFNSTVAYIFLVVFWILSSWLFFRTLFLLNQADVRDYFVFVPWIFLFLIPAVTMRIWSEEKRSGTWEVLLTWPVTEFETVLGKFFAAFVFILIAIIGSLIVPLLVSFLGDLDWGLVWANYLGILLLGSSYLAIGVWASSFTENQITAFLISLFVCFILFIIGQQFVLVLLPNGIAEFLKQISLNFHYESIVRGVIDSRDIIYYFSVIFFFLYLNIRNLEARKW